MHNTRLQYGFKIVVMFVLHRFTRPVQSSRSQDRRSATQWQLRYIPRWIVTISMQVQVWLWIPPIPRRCMMALQSVLPEGNKASQLFGMSWWLDPTCTYWLRSVHCFEAHKLGVSSNVQYLIWEYVCLLLLSADDLYIINWSVDVVPDLWSRNWRLAWPMVMVLMIAH
jgi:hypothetical protein